MNQQQLQTARAALWHQNAETTPDTALVTLDDARPWLEEIGLCLFLPRHTQLPAPAPSFVEACIGRGGITPPPAAISGAMDLVTRLVDERRAIPLNLLGTFSEQPDFLVTPEVLPWVAAIRGDRQWKMAPGGRTTPIVIRAWEALDRKGELTAVDIREDLGRELTEAAVLRALLELWTTLRAIPLYTPGEATRWTLLKHRHPAELTTAANTAQTTALSALLSIYLSSAVAATAEEAEIFLSPLTARSRIREVLHGMMATRQFGTTTVNAQTMLFVEGSLPEFAPEAPLAEPVAPPLPESRTAFRKQPQGTRPERRRDERKPERKPFRGKKPSEGKRPQRGRETRPFRRQEGSRTAGFGAQEQSHDKRPERGPFRKEAGASKAPQKEFRREKSPQKPFRREKFRPNQTSGEKREWRPREQRPPAGFAAPGNTPRGKEGTRRERPSFGERRGKGKTWNPSEPRRERRESKPSQRDGEPKFQNRNQRGRSGGERLERPQPAEGRSRRNEYRPRREERSGVSGKDRSPRPGGGFGNRSRFGGKERSGGRPFRSTKPAPPGKGFRKPGGERNPRKNRSPRQEENPE